MNKPLVDIILAVYEGKTFLKEQIESILSQTYTNIRLFIRDDLSSDGSLDVIKEFCLHYPEKIYLISSKERVGVKKNFSILMEATNAPYVMFSDQDDIWLPNKVEICLEKMQELEKNFGFHPFLVHSDLMVVDESLQVKNPSFWQYTHINPLKAKTLNRILNQNVVTGCAMMANRLLIEVAKPIPDECFMHDWWIALTAAAFGKIEIVQEPLIKYRQHGKNALGAKKFGSIFYVKEALNKIFNKETRKFTQATIFYHRFNELLSQKQRKEMQAFLNIPKESWGKKRMTIYKYGFFKQGFLRNFADFILG